MDLSDHSPIFHIVPCNDEPHPESHQLIILINHNNIEKYKIKIQNFDWSRVSQHDTCQEAIHVPLIFTVIKVKQCYRNRLPWLIDELKTDIKTKRKLYRILKKYETGVDKKLISSFLVSGSGNEVI